MRLLIASPLQQRLYERASMLRYTYISCFVFHADVKNTWTCAFTPPPVWLINPQTGQENNIF